jgi:seryl-tRNA synthetase
MVDMPTKDEPPFREALVKNADVVTIASQLDPMATAGWNLRQKEVDELRAENQRLRETIAEWQKIYGTLHGDVHAACQTEIESLRRQMAKWQADFEAEARNGERLLAAIQSLPAPNYQSIGMGIQCAYCGTAARSGHAETCAWRLTRDKCR